MGLTLLVSEVCLERIFVILTVPNICTWKLYHQIVHCTTPSWIICKLARYGRRNAALIWNTVICTVACSNKWIAFTHTLSCYNRSKCNGLMWIDGIYSGRQSQYILTMNLCGNQFKSSPRFVARALNSIKKFL